MKEFKGVISILGYVLLGILLVSFVLPMIDALTGLLLTMIEVAKGYFSVKVTEYNYRLKRMAYEAEEEDVPPQRLIGFAREDQEEPEDDENL